MLKLSKLAAAGVASVIEYFSGYGVGLQHDLDWSIVLLCLGNNLPVGALAEDSRCDALVEDSRRTSRRTLRQQS